MKQLTSNKASEAQSVGWLAFNKADRSTRDEAEDAWDAWLRAWDQARKHPDESTYEKAKLAQAKVVETKMKRTATSWGAWAKAWAEFWEAGPNPTEETP